MALVFKDRVKQKTTTVGSGDLTLIGVDADFQSFSQIGDGNDTYYTIASQNEWEVGVGTYNPSGVSSSWVQLGSDIDGEAAGDASGWSVSLSDDGTIMAIGAINNDSGGSNAGHVRVYEYSSGAWSQKGADIDGEAIGDESGYSVSLSSDGSIVAIGAINDDGSDSNAGHVRVYAWSGIAWVQRGADIEGEAADDNSGHSVSLSSDGSIVAIGARWNDAGGSQAGHVRVYEWNSGTSAWGQKGADIDGEATDDNSGYSVSLNHDGTVVAIGAHDNDDGPGSNAGHVRVYEYSGSSWSQKGADIDGEAAGDNSGWSVSLSSDGSIVAIGAIYNDGTDSNAGHVRVYEYSGGSWSQKGADIDGEASSDFSGHSVSLSSDGSIVAIGANLNDGVGSNAGHVRTFVRATLSRNTVLESSNLGNKISTTGTSTVFCTYPAEKSVYRNTNDQIVATASGIVFSNASVQTTAAASVAGSGLTLNSATFDANVASAVQTTAPNSITTTADKTYSIQVNGSDDLVVNVPWVSGSGGSDGDITSVVAGSGLSGGGTTGDVTLNALTASTSASGITILTNTIDSTQTKALTPKAVYDAGYGTMSNFILEDGDGTEVTIANGKEVKFVEGNGIDIDWTDTDNGTDADPYDLTFTVDHDAASNFVANEHIDHTSVTLTAGSGLSGGGDISANRTFHVSGVDTSLLQGTISTAQIGDDQVTAAKLANSINTDIATGVTANTTANAALPKAGGAMTGAITTNSTFDGVDIATRDGVLTTTTDTANAAAPKASPTFTGTIAIPNVANLETAVVANTAKNTNVVTDLTKTVSGTGYSINSSDGNDIALSIADTDNWGLMSDEMFDKLAAIEASATVDQSASDIKTLLEDGIDSVHYVDGSIDHVHLAGDCIDGDNIGDNVVDSEHYAAGSIDLEHMSSQSVDEDNIHISNTGSNGQFLSKQSGNDGGLTWATPTDTNTTYTAGTGITLNSTEFDIDPTLISARTDVTSADADYLLIWDATDSQLKKADAGEFRGGGGGGSVDIDALDALGGVGVHQTQDHFIFSDNGTEKKITFSNLQDAIFADISGDGAVAAGGALTIADDKIGSAELVDACSAVTSFTAPLIEGTTSIQTPLIEYTDGDDAIAIADGGAVTFAQSVNQAHEAGSLSSNVLSFDCSQSNYFEATVNAQVNSIVFTNATAGQRIVLLITNSTSSAHLSDANGWDTITINTNSGGDVLWAGGIEPTLTASGKDMYGIIFSSNVLVAHAFIIGQDIKA